MFVNRIGLFGVCGNGDFHTIERSAHGVRRDERSGRFDKLRMSFWEKIILQGVEHESPRRTVHLRERYTQRRTC